MQMGNISLYGISMNMDVIRSEYYLNKIFYNENKSISS